VIALDLIKENITTIVMGAVLVFPIAMMLFKKNPKAGIRDFRPLLIAMFAEAVALQDASKLSPLAFEKELIELVHQRIQEADIFTKSEKKLLSPKVIRMFIRPYLTESVKK